MILAGRPFSGATERSYQPSPGATRVKSNDPLGADSRLRPALHKVDIRRKRGPKGAASRPELRKCRFKEAAPATDRRNSGRGRAGAVLARKEPRCDEPGRMGEPVRRLRPLLPRQTRGRGFGRD